MNLTGLHCPHRLQKLVSSWGHPPWWNQVLAYPHTLEPPFLQSWNQRCRSDTGEIHLHSYSLSNYDGNPCISCLCGEPLLKTVLGGGHDLKKKSCPMRWVARGRRWRKLNRPRDISALAWWSWRGTNKTRWGIQCHNLFNATDDWLACMKPCKSFEWELLQSMIMLASSITRTGYPSSFSQLRRRNLQQMQCEFIRGKGVRKLTRVPQGHHSSSWASGLARRLMISRFEGDQ